MNSWEKFTEVLRNLGIQEPITSNLDHRGIPPQNKRGITVGPSASGSIRVGPADRNELVIRPGEVIRVTPNQAVVVEPPRRGLWDERGWTCERSNGRRYYQGFYQVRNRRSRELLKWPGRVLVEGHDEVTPYIADPPANLSQHPKGVCFQRDEGRWFRLHWHRKAANVDDAISYMEKILDELVNR
jgi:hypothetical protein